MTLSLNIWDQSIAHRARTRARALATPRHRDIAPRTMLPYGAIIIHSSWNDAEKIRMAPAQGLRGGGQLARHV